MVGTERLSRVKCRFECNRPVLVDDNITATQLFLIVQEAVRNVVRHARAQNIVVELEASKEEVVLQISDDGIGIYIVEDEVLFAGDVWMPIPHIVDGDSDTMKESLRKIESLTIENVVQGHGEVILRGEVYTSIEDRINYLDTIQKIADEASKDDFPGEYLKEKTIEICGKSRILLGGAAEEIHQQNLRHLYRKKYGTEPQGLDH